MNEETKHPVTLWHDGKKIDGDFYMDAEQYRKSFNINTESSTDHPPAGSIQSFQEFVQQKSAEAMQRVFAPANIFQGPETIDIDHEVIEPKQLPSHEKEQD